MIKRYKVTGKLYLDESRHDSVIVEANTIRKAIEYGKEALRKKHNAKSMLAVTCVKAEVIKDEN